jgi:hypothetical protein
MGFFDKVKKVTKDVAASTAKVVTNTSVDTVKSVAKDVGTSTTRIVTDTAIDLADVGTGFQFSDELDGAKKEMTDAGVLSAADAIEKNHYGFLKEMEDEARRKYDEVMKLYQQGTIAEAQRDQRANVLTDMLNDVSLLLQLYEEAKQQLEKASQIPNWQKWSQILDVPSVEPLQEVSTYTTQWDAVGQKVFQAKLGIDLSAGAAGGLSSLSAFVKTSKLMKVSKLSKASKFLKIGKLAGRASAVLSVVSIGIDVGLSVVQLEERKAQLKEYLRDLNGGIAEAYQDLAELTAELREIELRISELLSSVHPAQTELTWDNWVEDKKDELNRLRNRLISVEGIRETAIKIAKASRNKSYEMRVELIMASDPSISEDEAKQIIADVDQETV